MQSVKQLAAVQEEVLLVNLEQVLPYGKARDLVLTTRATLDKFRGGDRDLTRRRGAPARSPSLIYRCFLG